LERWPVPERPDGRVVVLSPHLDDAVLSVWSMLRGPGEVHVVNVCTGVPMDGLLSPWDRLTGATDSRSRMFDRLREDQVALARAGRKATSLDFPESLYRHGPLDPEALRGALGGVINGAAQVWAPAGIGGHDDHVQIRDTALGLAVDGGPELNLYADLPYAVKYGWPGWVRAQDDDPYLVVEAWWQRFLPADLDLAAAKHSLSAGDARGKLHALSAYRTQMPGLSGGPLESLKHPSIIRYEVSWSVRGGVG
jgi:LmbE family N-acetylglucosaminyl deacetylase